MGKKLLKKLDEMGVKPSELTKQFLNIEPTQILDDPILGKDLAGFLKSLAVIKDVLVQGYIFVGKYCSESRNNEIVEIYNQLGEENLYSLSLVQLTGLSQKELECYSKDLTYVFVKEEIFVK